MVLTIETKCLPAAVVGQPYDQTLIAAGATGAVTWSVTPSLPSCLMLDPVTGKLQGVATEAAKQTGYEFTATDTAGSVKLNLSMVVQNPTSKERYSSYLAIYLIALAAITGYLISSLWSSHPKSDPPGKVDCRNSKGPVLRSIYPSHLDVASGSGIFLRGCNLPPKTTVKMNGVGRTASVIDANDIKVIPNAADVNAAGPLIVTMFSETGVQFGDDTIWVVEPQFYWSAFGHAPWDIGLEMRLLLVALLAGAFSSSVYALKSLADYKGGGALAEPWSLYYLIQPIEGAGVAFLFYVAIRAGLLAGGSGDGKSVNLFGVCAMTGLAGAFSDLAFMKLREVFQTLFKPQDDRGGKTVAFTITTMALPVGVSTQPYDLTLKAEGGIGTLTWSIAPPLPSGLTLDAATGRLHGTSAVALSAKDFIFTVTDSSTPARSAKATLSLVIS
jgi:Putative Ig domain